MAIADNLHSRVVLWLKVVLPLAALALLSTLFLFARGSQTDLEIPYAEIEDIAREPRITGPRFAGIATDGSVVQMTAETIRPLADLPDAFAIAQIRIGIDTPDGAHVDMRAGSGELDGRARIARLTELVRLTTSSGYEMETRGIEADLQTGEVRSLGPLEVRAPYGALTAGSLTIRPGDGDDGGDGGPGQQMVFNGGVRLLYQPQN